MYGSATACTVMALWVRTVTPMYSSESCSASAFMMVASMPA